MKKTDRLRRELSFYLSPRYLFGFTLIVSAFISAFLITVMSDRTIEVWSAKNDLAPGMVISAADLSPTRVRLVTSADRYLDSDANLIGTTVVRSIGANELIPAYSLASEPDVKLRRVPLSVSSTDIPARLTSGSIVDIYRVRDQISDPLRPNIGPSSKILLREVAIESIDGGAREIGGSITLTLLVPELQVPTVIESISGSRFIVVRKQGS